MPVLTGTIADVTGADLPPSLIRQVFVKAPGERPSLADGGVLIVSAPVQLGSSGSLSVTLEPGPAVLTVDTVAGGPDVYDLYVTADMTLLSEAVAESAPAHERSWAESVMVQLRDEAVAAAGRAEAAAGNVDDAIAGAAGAVVAAVESDRVAAEAAAGAAASSASEAAGSASEAAGSASAAARSASDAAGSASGAASSAAAASGSATSAAGSARDAAGAVTDARAARDAAEGHATSAAGSAAAAASSATAADGHANRAEDAANSFDLTVTSSTLAPGAAATVTVTGDGPAYSLAFGVPQGPKGDKGDEGEISQDQLDAAVASLVDGAPEALNTLSELASALGDDPNFATTVSTQIGQRAKIDGAPTEYDTLGKLVAALQNHELGGSTDASLLTGALTDQVDVSLGVLAFEGAPPMALAAYLAQLTEWMGQEMAAKADADHTHTAADVGAAPATHSHARMDAAPATWKWAGTTLPTAASQVHAQARAGDFIVAPNLTANPGWHQITGV